MYRLMFHFLSVGSLISFFIFIYAVVLFILKKKLKKKVWRILCVGPLIISLIHFVLYFIPNDFIIREYIFMYILSILILIWSLFYEKKIIFKIYSIIIMILGLLVFLTTYYITIPDENVHVLTRYSYTKSFNKTIEILKKEYVLNEHKGIDYEYLYNKYYPLIEKAEKNKDEQLYFKTMFEFSRNFKDGHFYFSLYYNDIDKLIEKYDFMNDYSNRNYGFSSILLSDGQVAAILVNKTSEAYEKGLRDGMIITKKDNQDIEEVLDEIITPIGGYPVLEDERLINSFYLFSTGDDTVDVTFINEENNEVTINVKNTGELNIKHDEIYNKILYYDDTQENLDTRMLDDNTGYMYVSHEVYSRFRGAIGYLFDDSTYLTKVVDKKIEELKKQGMENIIIDLRSNSGGYFTESAAIASLFSNDNYLVIKETKNDSNLFDNAYLKGNGKYADIPIIVLVNADTASAGDCLTYLFKENTNAIIMGFTNSNNSAQSIGGLIFLSGGSSFISYPIYTTYDADKKIFIDTDSSRIAKLKLDHRVLLNQESVVEIFNTDSDYLLEYALKNID